MTTRVIVLNGGSSSGKSGIVRCLQAILPEPWLVAAVDSLVEALPAAMRRSDAGIEFAAAGRELARGDRPPGMAASQAEIVHEGVAYDLEVDTTRRESLDCARMIAARVE